MRLKKKMTDFSKILDKAKELENNMKKSQEKIKSITAEGVSGADKVKITLNGDGEIIKLFISDDIIKQEKEIVQDLVIAAHNNAKAKLKIKTEEEILKVTGGIGLQGFKWPI